ncbi:hypothetical protein [Paraglaciecola sp. 20A4]|uniref:hypothetical protein n=1 Tax=Paraglaciecola sp. 20A4 TaxID=2687288 RepID=UPI0014099B0F|nr:hypothetical protein [Paraglaciecola sp. 20A4]
MLSIIAPSGRLFAYSMSFPVIGVNATKAWGHGDVLRAVKTRIVEIHENSPDSGNFYLTSLIYRISLKEQ